MTEMSGFWHLVRAAPRWSMSQSGTEPPCSSRSPVRRESTEKRTRTRRLRGAFLISWPKPARRDEAKQRGTPRDDRLTEDLRRRATVSHAPSLRKTPDPERGILTHMPP